MPRPERVLDPEAGPVQRFAIELRRLRARAGSPGYRALGARAHYSASTLAAAARGDQLPSLAVTLAYVRACDGDSAEWEKRWRALSAELNSRPVESAEEPPYVGLRAFHPDDAGRFFGRDRLVAKIVERLEHHRLVAVVGASGSGKSSVLAAGLPLDGWLRLTVRPGAHPLRECAAALAAAAGVPAAELGRGPAELGIAAEQVLVNQPHEGLLLVVDQFEEVFSLCDDEDERASFIAALLATAGKAAHRTKVVLGLRSDFYPHCAQYAELAEAVESAQVLVGQMSADELRQAVTLPAREYGCTVETALVARVIADASGQVGVLPLVSHALLQTWRRRRGNALTLAGYEAAGGIERAVARTAEAVYLGLDPDQQPLARQVLMRLVAVGEDTDSRRRISREELDDADVETVLDRLTGARLLTRDHGRIDLAHEALIHHWPRLRAWLDEDREGLRVHRELAESALAWETHEREESLLFRGVRLAVARRRTAGAQLTRREKEFLAASDRAEARQHALTRRRIWQLRWLAAGLVVLLAVAVGAAALMRVERREALVQSTIATSRQLAAEALNIAGADRAKAIELSIDAWHAYPTQEARSAVLSAKSAHGPTAAFPLDPVWNSQAGDLVFSADGRWLVSVPMAQDVISFWDTMTRSPGSQVFLPQAGEPSPRTGPSSVAVGSSRDGRYLAVRYSSRTFVLDTVTREQVPRTVPAAAEILLTRYQATPGVIEVRTAADEEVATFGDVPEAPRELVTSADGSTVAVLERDRVRLWRLGSGQVTTLPTRGLDAQALALSADGGLAAVSDGPEITVWDTGSATQLMRLRGHARPVSDLDFDNTGTLHSAADTVASWDLTTRRLIAQLPGDRSAPQYTAADVSPDGRHFAAASTDGRVLLWERSALPLIGHSYPVSAVAFGSGGTTLTSADSSGRGTVWDPAARTGLPATGPSPGTAPVTALSADGTRLAVTTAPDTITVTDTRTRQVVRTLPTEPVTAMAFDADGTRLATSAGALWNLADGGRRGFGATGATIHAVAFSADGTRLIASTALNQVHVWDARTLERQLVFENQPGVYAPVVAVAINAGGTLAATTDSRGETALWRLDPPVKAAVLASLGGTRFPLAFSPDGRLLATSGAEHTAVIWDTTTLQRWATLHGHTGPVTALAWHPAGTALATGSDDQTITTWSLDADAASAALCGDLARDFPARYPAPAC